VTSSITVLWEKLNVYYQIVIKNLKGRIYGYKTMFFILNFHLNYDLKRNSDFIK